LVLKINDQQDHLSVDLDYSTVEADQKFFDFEISNTDSVKAWFG
jgi:hypothetical protein